MEEFLPVADQLKVLFESRVHPENRPYTLQEVSDATGISLATISQLRTGRIKNPQFSTLVALSRFFEVPLRYFETRTVEECYALLRDRQEPEVKEISEIAFRATHLSPEGQRDLLTVLKWIQAAEQQRKDGISMPPLFGLEQEDDGL